MKRYLRAVLFIRPWFNNYPKPLSSNSPLLAARDEFEFACYQLHRRVSRADVIPCSLLQGEFIWSKDAGNKISLTDIRWKQKYYISFKKGDFVTSTETVRYFRSLASWKNHKRITGPWVPLSWNTTAQIIGCLYSERPGDIRLSSCRNAEQTLGNRILCKKFNSSRREGCGCEGVCLVVLAQVKLKDKIISQGSARLSFTR
jgi:hypothetical protein